MGRKKLNKKNPKKVRRGAIKSNRTAEVVKTVPVHLTPVLEMGVKKSIEVKTRVGLDSLGALLACIELFCFAQIHNMYKYTQAQNLRKQHKTRMTQLRLWNLFCLFFTTSLYFNRDDTLSQGVFIQNGFSRCLMRNPNMNNLVNKAVNDFQIYFYLQHQE